MKPSDRELLCKAILHQVPASGRGAKDVLVLLWLTSALIGWWMLYYNSSLASQKNKTLCTVLYLLFATSKTVNAGPEPCTIWSMPSSHFSGPYSPCRSLQTQWWAFFHLLEDASFFSLQSPGERLLPPSVLTLHLSIPFLSFCTAAEKPCGHGSVLQFKFLWYPMPFLHSTLLSYNSEIIHLISTSTLGASLVAQRLERLPAMWETGVRSLGWEDPLEKEMATHSSILAERIPLREEPGRLQSTESRRVGHNSATSLSLSFHPGKQCRSCSHMIGQQGSHLTAKR